MLVSTVITNGSPIGLDLTHWDEGFILNHTGWEPISNDILVLYFLF